MRALRAELLPLIVILTACGGGSGSGSAELGPTLGLTNAHNITLDPFGTAPLSARLAFSTPVAGTVKLTVMGKAPDLNDANLNDDKCSAANPEGITIAHHFTDSANNFILPVLGLYPDFNNTLIVEFFADNGGSTQDELMIRTGPLPEVPTGQVTLPIEVEVIENNLLDDSGVFVLSQQKSGFDQCGEVRWFYRGEGWQFYELLPNGNWLGTINTEQISYHFGSFAEFTMLGEKVREYPVDNYVHHEIQKLPWGNYLVATNSPTFSGAPDGNPEEDMLVEIRAADGIVVKEWNFNDILDPGREPIPSNDNDEDWLHLNSAVYDASDNSIVITAQRQSLAAKIDYTSGDLIWILGSHEGWTEGLGFDEKMLTPVDALGNPIDIDAEYFWPYGPHAALTFGFEEGHGAIAIFDNGAWRGWYGDRAPLSELGEQDFSRGIEYFIDEENMTVRIEWQFDWDKKVFTSITGDIDYLANGDYLIGFVGNIPAPPGSGTIADNPRIMQVDTAGNIRFNALSNRGELEYRVEKIDLYAGQ